MWPFRKKPCPSTPWERTPPSKPTAYLDEEGRRHRTDAPYLLPKDGKEFQRLDYQHYIFKHILQGNTFAPVNALLKKGANVLDVGGGTGRWGHEVAEAYPHSQVISLDLEDIPRTASMPLNFQFYQGNLLEGLPFAAQQFHYVHQRLLVAGIPFQQWPFVMRELKRVAQPGGWVELIEMGTTFHHAGPATKQFLEWLALIGATRGIDVSKVSEIGTLLYHSGFSNTHAKTETIPVGSWGGRIGNLFAQDLLAGWPSMKSSAHSLLNVSSDVFDAVIGRLETEWNTYQTQYEVYFACGQG
jgi:SAM-dependent methyltransferase